MSYSALRDAQAQYEDVSEELAKVNKTISRNQEKRDDLELQLARAQRILRFVESTLPQQQALPFGEGLSLVPDHVHAWGEWEEKAEEHIRTRHCACGKRQHECIHEFGEVVVDTWDTESGPIHRITRTCRFCSRLEVAIPHAIPAPPETPEEYAEPYRPLCTACGAEKDEGADYDICRWAEVEAEPVVDEQAKRLYYGSEDWNADKRSWEDLTDGQRESWKAQAEEKAGERWYVGSPLYGLTGTPWADLPIEEQEKWIGWAVGRAIVEPEVEGAAEEAADLDDGQQLEMDLDAPPFETAEDDATEQAGDIDEDDVEDEPPVEEAEQPAASDESEMAVETPARRGNGRPRKVREAEVATA